MKYILLTGASSGIGEATARYLSKEGYGLIMVARNKEKLDRLAAELGEQHHCVEYDLHDTEHMDSIFEYIKKTGLLLDGMVYCAGIAGNMPVRGLDLAATQDMMQVNCISFAAMSKLMINRKYSKEGASIVALSSLSSYTCYPGTAAYSMSKSALISVCKVLAKETLKRKIRVNAILPGYVRTPMTAGTEEMNNLQEQQPWGFIEPEEIAYMIEFLLSDKSRFITGAQIPVSGGMSF